MAAKIHQLRKQREEQKEKANAALRAMQAQAKTEGRVLSDAEKAEDDKARASIAVLDSEMETEERILASERRYGSDLPHEGDEPPVPGAGPVPDPKDPAKATAFGGIGQRLLAVKAAAKGSQFTDRRLLAAAAGASESVDSDGGFLVGVEDGGTLLEQTYETGILASRVRKQPIGAGFNGTKIKLINETSRANGSRFGGIQVYWSAEANAVTASSPTWRELELKLKKLHGLMYMTDELLEDAVALEGHVNEWFPQEFGFKLDDAIFAGPGGGLPLGITTCPALVAIAKETGQAAGSVTAPNIYKMFAAMPASSLAKAEWFINVAVWPQLFALSQPVGTGGMPIFVPAGGISGAPFGTLLGRPIIPIEQASALGTLGDIVFADLSQYMLIDKGPIKSAASMHVKFLTDEMAFRWTLRVDGKPIPNAAKTPYKGAQDLSPFVALATRA